MIYVQLRARVKLAQGETLHVADAAKVLGSEKAGHCSLFCPTSVSYTHLTLPTTPYV